VETIFFEPLNQRTGFAVLDGMHHKLSRLRTLDFPLEEGLPDLMDTSPIQGTVEPLNLGKIIKFNENLYSDLLKKDMTG